MKENKYVKVVDHFGRLKDASYNYFVCFLLRLETLLKNVLKMHFIVNAFYCLYVSKEKGICT